MERASCCNGEVKKGSWTVEEDRKLIAYIEKHGEGGWRSMPTRAGLQRCGKSCRLRWKNYLRPGIKRGTFTLEEEETIIRLHAELGNRWSAIAKYLPQRTDNEIKNYWNAQLKKRLINVGVDPTAHQPMQGSMPDAGRSSLLNKLATQLPRSHSVETIKAIIMPSHQCSPSPTADDDDDMATMFQALSSFSEASPSCSIEAPMWDCMDGGASLGLDVDENVSQGEYEDLDFDMFDHVF